MQNAAYLQEITARIIKTREHTKQVLAEMGFQFPDSKSNFLFVTHPDCDAHEYNIMAIPMALAFVGELYIDLFVKHKKIVHFYCITVLIINMIFYLMRINVL